MSDVYFPPRELEVMSILWRLGSATVAEVREGLEGLQAGERVITDGVDRIREGAKVEVTEPGAGLRGGPGAGAGAAAGAGTTAAPLGRAGGGGT